MNLVALVCAALAAVGISRIWLVDFEYRSGAGELTIPLCMVAREFESGRTIRWWEDELRAANGPPYDIDAGSVMVCYYAAAEASCHLALGWPLPTNILDLFTEFRVRTNGLPTPCGVGLLGAMTFFGLPCMGAAEKERMRALVLRGGPYSPEERAEILDYCESDVVALAALLPHMAPTLALDIARALLRGRYMRAVAHMERTGVPINVEDLGRLRSQWDAIRGHLIERVDRDYGVFDDGSFNARLWRQWTERRGIPWPELPSGAQALDKDTFREMARLYPQVNTMHELRVSLSQLHPAKLAVEEDGRNHCMLSAFRARTGRNQPSTTQFIFGPAKWIRSLIQASPGRAVAYVDWRQQEFGIAAALSGDSAMKSAYASGDAYMASAIQAGAAPPGATEDTYPLIREKFKICALGVMFTMGVQTLAERIGQSEAHARLLLDLHKQTYPEFWRWSEAALDYAMLNSVLPTVFGWRIHVAENANPRSLRNFPMQANGSEMLRLACCFATERGITVCAPVHDALLIEAPSDHIEEAVVATQKAMADASRIVLDGFELRTEAKIFKYPDRFTDKRGHGMWNTVWRIIDELDRAAGSTTGPVAPPSLG